MSGSKRRVPMIPCKGKRLNFDLTKEEGEEHRHYSCLDYNDCLTAAAHYDWRSFSCKKCDTFILYLEELAAEPIEVEFTQIHEIWQTAINIGGKD